jgi:[ribosomal protein S5]-alanine N-acetyltransferase
MAFLRSSTPDDWALGLYGRGLMLRPPRAEDFDAWAALRSLSRQHLQPWEPRWSDDELSRQSYRRRLRVYARDMGADSGYAFFVFRARDNVLLGGVTLSNVRRGVAQAASVGYWVGVGFTGCGYMTEAMRTIVPFAFDQLRLHRLEAACLPANNASMRVLEKTGFAREGLAAKYLKIDGLWQDHVLFGLVEREPGGKSGQGAT